MKLRARACSCELPASALVAVDDDMPDAAASARLAGRAALNLGAVQLVLVIPCKSGPDAQWKKGGGEEKWAISCVRESTRHTDR